MWIPLPMPNLYSHRKLSLSKTLMEFGLKMSWGSKLITCLFTPRTSYSKTIAVKRVIRKSLSENVHSCSKVMGFFLRWQHMVFISKVQTWNFMWGIRRSFAFAIENIFSVWYTATPGWTSKFGKVWKTRCQNAATRANIWRCFLVSWDDKYLWVMVSNNGHELYFCSKLLCFSSIHCFLAKYGIWISDMNELVPHPL